MTTGAWARAARRRRAAGRRSVGPARDARRGSACSKKLLATERPAGRRRCSDRNRRCLYVPHRGRRDQRVLAGLGPCNAEGRRVRRAVRAMPDMTDSPGGGYHGYCPLEGFAMSDSLRFFEAIKRIDAANAEDPNRGSVDGREAPAELLYGQRMTRWLDRLEPQASEPLRLAVRSQHLC